MLILKGPLMAGLVVVAASPSGPLGVLREMFAVGKLVNETKTQAEGAGGFSNSLLRSIVADLASPDARAQLDVSELRAVPPPQLQSHALEACRALAQRTAEAAKEGGFLGIGGTRVSENETVATRDVARALGVAPPA